jgi:hypothetical protein
METVGRAEVLRRLATKHRDDLVRSNRIYTEATFPFFFRHSAQRFF